MSHMKTLDTTPSHPVLATEAPHGFNPMECGSLDRRWYAVEHNAGEAGLLLPALHRIGLTTFRPVIRIAIPDRRCGKRIVLEPAFPGYIFAEWGSATPWQRMFGKPGYKGIIHAVGDRLRPIPVPRSQMDALMARAKDGGVIEDASVAPVLAPIEAGVTVRLTDGPFAGHVGLCGRSTAERVSILLTIMGCERAVTAKRRYVEAVS